MRIETNAKVFLETLDKALALVASRSTLPVLECVQVTAGNGLVYMTAMNATHETKTIQIQLKAMVDGVGTFLIGKEQYNLIKKMGNNQLVIEVEPDAGRPIVTCKCGKRRYDFQMDYTNDSYPSGNIYGEDIPACAMMHSQDLLDAMNRLVATTSNEEAHTMMRFFHMDFAKQRMETIDGHRIGIRELSDIKIVKPDDAMIDTLSLKALRKVIGKDDCMVWICADEKHVRIKGDGWVYTQRKPDGKWFDIDKMLTNDFSAEMNVEISDMKEAVDYILSMKTGDPRTPMIMEMTDDGLMLNRVGAGGQVSDVLAVDNYYGKFERSGFDPTFIKDACNTLDTDTMRMEWRSPKAPMMLIGDMYKVLVLPVNIGA